MDPAAPRWGCSGGHMKLTHPAKARFKSEWDTSYVELVPNVIGIRSILVPIDFSPASKRALQYAGLFAQQFGTKIHLIHVCENYAYAADVDFGAVLPPLAQTVAARKKELAKFARKFVDTRNLGKIVVRPGRPFEEIVKFAKQVDLVIIATHGYTGFRHLLLGSTTEKVVRYATCPVLTFRVKNSSKK
jgi:universal stress protein A